MSIISKIWDGEIIPIENFEKNLELKDKWDNLENAKVLFYDKLDDKLKEEFRTLMDANLCLLSDEMGRIFAEGCKFGAQIILELNPNSVNSDNEIIRFITDENKL